MLGYEAGNNGSWMRRAFFDANIYNHISDAEIKLVKQGAALGHIELLSTPQILAELAATFKKDRDRAIDLRSKYAQLITQNVLQPPPVLLQTEIASLLNRRRLVLYLDGDNKTEFFTYVEKLRNGDLDPYTEQFIGRITRLKKEQFKLSKLGFSRMEALVLKEPLNKFPTFDQFLREGIARGERRKEIERYVVKDLGKNAGKAANFIEKRLHKLPHLAITLRVVPALTYYYHVEKNRPKHGDIFDCGYFVCLATVSTFISNDEGARELFKLVCPTKECLSLSDFIVSMN